MPLQATPTIAQPEPSRIHADPPLSPAEGWSADATAVSEGEKPALESRPYASAADEVAEAVEARTWERRARRSASGEEEEVGAAAAAVARVSSSSSLTMPLLLLLLLLSLSPAEASTLVGTTMRALVAAESLGREIAAAAEGAAARGIGSGDGAAKRSLVVGVKRMSLLSLSLFLPFLIARVCARVKAQRRVSRETRLDLEEEKSEKKEGAEKQNEE